MTLPVWGHGPRLRWKSAGVVAAAAAESRQTFVRTSEACATRTSAVAQRQHLVTSLRIRSPSSSNGITSSRQTSDHQRRRAVTGAGGTSSNVHATAASGADRGSTATDIDV